MKKFLLLLALFTIIFISAKAGYIIKGVNTSTPSASLINFTVALDINDAPVSAASMHTTFLGGGTGLNSIAIIPADRFSPTTYFPILFSSGLDENFNIIVRDFQYEKGADKYVLCGSRETDTYSHAFIAVIEGDLTTMYYNEYPEAETFYSVWAESPLSAIMLGYFVCGKKGERGVIASIHRSTLQFINFFITREDQKWEYHKIISKTSSHPQHSPRFIASGRTPDCTHIGFTTLEINYIIDSYMWEQRTEPASHCVVCNYSTEYDKIVLASSYQGSVTLNPVTVFGAAFAWIDAYRFNFLSTPQTAYNVQDIGMFDVNDVPNPRISVVGYVGTDVALYSSTAWHGYVAGLSPTSAMRNNFYGGSNEDFKHYKIKGNQQGDEFTGGYYQNFFQMGALFGTPLTPAIDCDHHNTIPLYAINELPWVSFYLEEHTPSKYDPFIFYQEYLLLPFYTDCTPFRGETPAPELVMAVETESEITTYYDRITVKDILTNTPYQIYSVTGQLIQTGVTNSDISTTQLSKGTYILRLENGKAFKFVK